VVTRQTHSRIALVLMVDHSVNLPKDIRVVHQQILHFIFIVLFCVKICISKVFALSTFSLSRVVFSEMGTDSFIALYPSI